MAMSTYYRARMAYYLYPRRVRVVDLVSAPAKGCEYIAVFRDFAAKPGRRTFPRQVGRAATRAPPLLARSGL